MINSAITRLTAVKKIEANVALNTLLELLQKYNAKESKKSKSWELFNGVISTANVSRLAADLKRQGWKLLPERGMSTFTKGGITVDIYDNGNVIAVGTSV